MTFSYLLCPGAISLVFSPGDKSQGPVHTLLPPSLLLHSDVQGSPWLQWFLRPLPVSHARKATLLRVLQGHQQLLHRPAVPGGSGHHDQSTTRTWYVYLLSYVRVS